MFRLTLSLCGAFVLIAAMLYVGGSLVGRPYGFDSPGSAHEWERIGILSLGTLLGLTSQALIAQLRAIRTKEISIAEELKKLVRSKAFWIALFASPIVLISAYKALSEVQGSLMVFCISYQNGFFWNSVIAARAKG